MRENTERRISCENGEGEEPYRLSITPEPDGTYASYYEVDIPLAESFHCRICAPVPKIYKRHGDLSKHFLRYHLHRLVFKCRGCKIVFDTLKRWKYHQKSTSSANAAAPPSTPPPTMPDTQVGPLPVLRSRMPLSFSSPTSTAALDRIPATDFAAPPSTDSYEPSTTCTSKHQRPDKDPLTSVTETPPPAFLTEHTDPLPEWNTALECTESTNDPYDPNDDATVTRLQVCVVSASTRQT